VIESTPIGVGQMLDRNELIKMFTAKPKEWSMTVFFEIVKSAQWW
jgi:hypothetical protein